MHMANRYLKRCSISLIIRDIQIKTIVSYHFTPLKIAVSKKARDNKCEDVEKEHLLALLVGM